MFKNLKGLNDELVLVDGEKRKEYEIQKLRIILKNPLPRLKHCY